MISLCERSSCTIWTSPICCPRTCAPGCLRKSIVEPVFGQIKQARGFRQFSLGGLAKVTAEWDLVALTHNLLKLFRSGWRRGAGPAMSEFITEGRSLA